MENQNNDNSDVMQQAAVYLYRNIKSYQFEQINEIFSSEEFPTDFPITDTRMSGFSFACSLPDNSDKRKEYNLNLL